jgi:hypothetical protein
MWSGGGRFGGKTLFPCKVTASGEIFIWFLSKDRLMFWREEDELLLLASGIA